MSKKQILFHRSVCSIPKPGSKNKAAMLDGSCTCHCLQQLPSWMLFAYESLGNGWKPFITSLQMLTKGVAIKSAIFLVGCFFDYVLKTGFCDPLRQNPHYIPADFAYVMHYCINAMENIDHSSLWKFKNYQNIPWSILYLTPQESQSHLLEEV